MKLVHPELSAPLIEKNIDSVEWIIELPQLFAKYVQELYIQSNGKEGSFVLSRNNRIVDIAKNVEMILNPFAVDINEKKIINKLYTQLSDLAMAEENYLYTQEVMQMISKYLLDLEQKTEHILFLENQIDLSLLFKAAGVRYEIYEENFVQAICRYIKVVCDVLKIKLVVLVNIRSYLADEELEEIIKEANYQEVKILLIENQEKSCLKGVKRYIIDADQCEIY